jgi:hypothetical protein
MNAAEIKVQPFRAEPRQELRLSSRRYERCGFLRR